jgi:hypothetical protein
MTTAAAQFDLSTAFLDQPKTIAYGLVRGAGNLILQHELSDKSRVSFYMLGEGPWDSIVRLWVNNKLVALPSSSTVHFHPGVDGEIGYGLSPVSTGGDQHVDQFFTLIPGGLDPITFSRFAWLALKTAPDPDAPSAQLTVLADYQAMQVRQFDSSGNQTAFAWTQNWAWIICDYLIRKFILREGKANQPLTAAELARFDWSSFAAAAAYYDAVIAAQQASDNFFRANANPIGGKSATVPGCSAMQILSNVAQGTAIGRNAAYATSAPFKSDGFSEITIGNLGTSADYVGATHRAGLGASENEYIAHAQGPLGASAVLTIQKAVAGVVTNLATGTFTVNAGDLLRLECVGTALTLKLNGVVKLTASDSALPAGNPGIFAYVGSGALNLATIAGWSGGSFAKRFSDGGVVYANDGQNASNVLEQMLMLCRSYLLERNGKLSLYADQARASVFTFTTDNIAPLSFKAAKSNLRGATNRFVATYRDSDIALGSTDDATRFAISSLPVDHEAHQRAVGARGAGLSVLPKVTELAIDLGVNTSERAWRILGSMLLRQLGPDVDANSPYNAPFSAEWTGFEDSLAVEPGDVVTIDPSISEEFGGKLIEVLETDEKPDGTRDIIGLEYMPNSFLDAAPVQQTLEAPLPGTGLGPVIVVDGSGVTSVPLDNTSDSLNRFARTAAHSTYRSLTNMLTATDAGASATIPVAASSLRVPGLSDVSYGSGSIAALSYSTLYFIYADDPNFAGGAVTYGATTTKETALSGTGRIFFGSIITPAAGGSDTIGNNDGGVGAQSGGLSVFLGGSNTVGYSGANYTLTGVPANFYDGKTDTYFGVVISGGSGVCSVGGNFLGMSPTCAPWKELKLHIRTAFPTCGANVLAYLAYSLDAGANWTVIFNSTGVTRALTEDMVTLSRTQNLAQVVISATLNRTSGAASGEMRLHEYWVAGVL